MQSFKSFIRKLFVVGIIIIFGSACGLPTNSTSTILPGITLLIKNEGITPITLRDRTGKLAWIFPSKEECVTLRSVDVTQRLTVQVGRSRLYITSVAFAPISSPTRSWIWYINERLPFLSAGRIYWAASPCKK